MSGGLAESDAMAAAFEVSVPVRRIGFEPEFEFGFRNSRLTFKLKLACDRTTTAFCLQFDN